MATFNINENDFSNFNENKKTKKISFSIQMYEKDILKIFRIRLFKIQTLNDMKFNNTVFFEEGIEILKEKYDIPMDKIYPKINLGRDNPTGENIKGTTVSLEKESIDYIKSFIGYKNYVEGNLRYYKRHFVVEIIELLEKKYNQTF